MKRLFTFCFSFFALYAMQGQAVLTAVYDGPLPGGLPKGVEIYIIDNIPDLTVLGVSSANNGTGATGVPEFILTGGSATAGQYIYVTSDGPAFTAFFGFDADFVDGMGSVNINGNDAMELFFNGSVIDVFGDVDTDGTGEPWEHLDGWAARVPATGPDGATFQLANWTFSGIDALDGETTNATAATPVPFTSYTGGMVTPDHTVTATNFMFTPEILVVDVGEIVQWDNTMGNHNVNGTTATYPDNTEDFFSGAVAPAPWSFQHTFLNPGNNDYQCDQHLAQGMVGQVMVREVGDHYVGVENNFFTPADITIQLGETVVWTNVSGLHNVNGTLTTYPDNPIGFGNGDPNSNWTSARIFTEPGFYNYQCDPHIMFDMVGTITVQSPYSVVDMSTVIQVDGDGIALYQDSMVSLTGIVYGPNYRTGTGVEFYLIDGNNDGVYVRTTSAAPAYTVTEGDALMVSGQINQFNGLIQLVPNLINNTSAGNTLLTPREVTGLNESSESSFITLTGLTLVDTAQWPDDNTNANVQALKGTDTVIIRIDRDIDFTIPAPLGLFDVVGLGGQFDNTSPFDDGYQIFPRGNQDIIDATAITDVKSIGVTSIYPNPTFDVLHIESKIAMKSIELYDMSGNRLLRLETDTDVYTLPTSKLITGPYFLKIQTDNGVGVSKIMKL